MGAGAMEPFKVFESTINIDHDDVLEHVCLISGGNSICDVDKQKVEVIFTASHPHCSDLQIELVSPMGTRSVLADVHGFGTFLFL